MQRWEIINALIQEMGYKSYLEIGTFTGWCYRQINCEVKTGVEPERVDIPGVLQTTSDEFFRVNNGTYDIIFIDGLHHWEQCLKDIFNSMAILNPNGTIIVHDCNPENEQQAARTAILPEWTGDVWKAIAILRSSFPFAKVNVIDTDWGCGIITPLAFIPKIANGDYVNTIKLEDLLQWDTFEKHRKEILGLISVDEFKKAYLR